MKTLLIAASIFVTSHGKTIKLTNDQVTKLKTYSTQHVKSTIDNCKGGCNIRNNEAADQIFIFLK